MKSASYLQNEKTKTNHYVRQVGDAHKQHGFLVNLPGLHQLHSKQVLALLYLMNASEHSGSPGSSIQD